MLQPGLIAVPLKAINQITLDFLLFLTYLLGDTYFDDIHIINTVLFLYDINKKLVSCTDMHLFSNNSQKTWKCGENITNTLGCCLAYHLFFSYHIVTASAIYYLNRPTAREEIRNVFIYMYIWINDWNLLSNNFFHSFLLVPSASHSASKQQ